MLVLFIAAILAATVPNPSAGPASPHIVIQDYAFKPAVVTVGSGTEIEWTNKDDDPHIVTADDGSFDSKGLGQGDVYRKRFAQPGRYAYHCAAHPFMKGVVIVRSAAQ